MYSAVTWTTLLRSLVPKLRSRSGSLSRARGSRKTSTTAGPKGAMANTTFQAILPCPSQPALRVAKSIWMDRGFPQGGAMNLVQWCCPSLARNSIADSADRHCLQGEQPCLASVVLVWKKDSKDRGWRSRTLASRKSSCVPRGRKRDSQSARAAVRARCN